MRGTRAAVVLVSLLLTVTPAFSQQQPAEDGIPETLRRYLDAFNARDARAAAATYTENGSHTYALGFTHHGRAEIARGLDELFAGPLKGARMSGEILRITSLAPTVAVEESVFTLDGLASPDGQPLPRLRGLCLVTYQYTDEQWLIAAAQCLVPPPAPEPR